MRSEKLMLIVKAQSLLKFLITCFFEIRNSTEGYRFCLDAKFRGLSFVPKLLGFASVINPLCNITWLSDGVDCNEIGIPVV